MFFYQKIKTNSTSLTLYQYNLHISKIILVKKNIMPWLSITNHKKNVVKNMLFRKFSTKKFLITGASGQIGQKLIPYMYKRYGENSIVVSDLRQVTYEVNTQPVFTRLDVTVLEN
jgi:FlaA1/EpsC-like NDP-sugar epimerase